MVKAMDLINRMENRYGYSKGQKLSKEEFEKILMIEELGNDCIIEYNSECKTIENRIIINKVNSRIEVIKTGERGTHSSTFFDTIEEAYAYVIFQLRIRKNVSKQDFSTNPNAYARNSR